MDEHKTLLRRLRKAGWTLLPKRSRHLKVQAPDGRVISLVSSGDRRAIKNWINQHAPEVK